MIYVNLSKCRRVKRKIFDEHKGGFKAKYALLYNYVEELRYTNKGSTVEVLLDKEDPERLKFKSFYICFTACKDGWKAGCRPITGLDDCFFQEICKKQLLCVVGRKGAAVDI